MTRFLLVILTLLCAGCYVPREQKQDPPPVHSPHSVLAEEVARDYFRRMAAVSREVAGRVESMKSNADVYDAVQKQSGEAHKAAFLRLSEAENELIQPDGDYDKQAIREMLFDEADGFERAVGGVK